jgi:imidazolonepropionase
MTTLIINIKELLQVREIGCQSIWCRVHSPKNAYLLLEDNLIADFGSMYSVPKVKADKTIDANGKMILRPGATVIPIVYAGNREQEFVDINGLSYEEIANRGGGLKFS